MGVGVKERICSEEDVQAVFAKKPLNGGIALVLKTLEEAVEPIVIHIVGSCRDLAAAISERPDLFRTKCKAIYLNAGTGYDDTNLEYNVALDAFSYSKLFMVPCPVYWMPCFHTTNVLEVGEYGTYYRFKQKEILPCLSEKVQNYFMYALGRVCDQRWLSYLERPVDQRLLEAHGNLYRNMWCTGGFLHMVGKTVTREGNIVPLTTEGIQPVFEFAPIKVTCDENGRTRWQHTEEASDKFIFRVLDLEAYEAAMTKALKQLLEKLP